MVDFYTAGSYGSEKNTISTMTAPTTKINPLDAQIAYIERKLARAEAHRKKLSEENAAEFESRAAQISSQRITPENAKYLIAELSSLRTGIYFTDGLANNKSITSIDCNARQLLDNLNEVQHDGSNMPKLNKLTEIG